MTDRRSLLAALERLPTWFVSAVEERCSYALDGLETLVEADPDQVASPAMELDTAQSVIRAMVEAVAAAAPPELTAPPHGELIRELTLREHRDVLHESHRNISNYGGHAGREHQDAFEALLLTTIACLVPDYDPRYVVEIRLVD